MLAAMRKTAGSTFAKIFLFGILILSFAVWGVADFVAPPDQNTTAAYVGDREISLNELDRAYREELNRVNLSGIDPEQARSLGIGNRVLDGLIAQTLIDQEANRLGLSAADQTVVQAIQSNPLFLDSLGQFQRARYEQFLTFSGLSEAGYVAQIRQEVARQQLLESMIAGVEAPSDMARSLFAYRNETREAAFIEVPVDPDSEVAPPSEADLAAFFEEDSETFRKPQYRSATYIAIDADTMAQRIEVSEAAIEESYRQRVNEFTTPERRAVVQMLTPDRETAAAALERVRSGEDFEAVAEDLADQNVNSIDFGMVTAAEIPDEAIAEAAFALEEGAVSEPTEGIFGWFIVTVTDISEGGQLPLEDVRDRLRRDLALNQAIEDVFQLSTEIDDQLGGGATLEEAAAALGLTVSKLDAVDASGLDEDGRPVDVPDRGKFVETLFDTPEGADSLMEETRNNGYFVLRNDAVIESRIPALDEIRDMVIAVWQDQQRFEAARSRVEALESDLASGMTLSEIAEREGLEVQTTDPFTRRSSAAALPDAVVQALFQGNQGSVATGRGTNAYVLAQLTAINTVNPLETDTVDAIAGTQRQLSIGMSNDLLVQFRAALQEDASVKIDQEVVDQVY